MCVCVCGSTIHFFLCYIALQITHREDLRHTATDMSVFAVAIGAYYITIGGIKQVWVAWKSARIYVFTAEKHFSDLSLAFETWCRENKLVQRGVQSKQSPYNCNAFFYDIIAQQFVIFTCFVSFVVFLCFFLKKKKICQIAQKKKNMFIFFFRDRIL